jgi:hypothetical protein
VGVRVSRPVLLGSISRAVVVVVVVVVAILVLVMVVMVRQVGTTWIL